MPLLGTSVEAIDLAEDRGRFGALLAELGYKAPPYATARSVAQALRLRRAGRLPAAGAPVLRARRAGDGDRLLARWPGRLPAPRGRATASPGQVPEIFLDRFLEDATEVDVDALCDGAEVWIGGIMQHVEEAGIHSGDSACVLPPHSLGEEMLDADPRRHARARAGDRRRRADQRAVRRPRRRAVRDRGQPARLAHRAVRLQGGRAAAGQARLPDHARRVASPSWTCRASAKESASAITSASRRPCCRSTASRAPTALLGPEMRSTGEVMGIARDFPTAFAKAQAAAGAAAAQRGHGVHHRHRLRQGGRVRRRADPARRRL